VKDQNWRRNRKAGVTTREGGMTWDLEMAGAGMTAGEEGAKKGSA